MKRCSSYWKHRTSCKTGKMWTSLKLAVIDSVKDPGVKKSEYMLLSAAIKQSSLYFDAFVSRIGIILKKCSTLERVYVAPLERIRQWAPLRCRTAEQDGDGTHASSLGAAVHISMAEAGRLGLCLWLMLHSILVALSLASHWTAISFCTIAESSLWFEW